ncbi:heterokaryon incompatibility protein-domain-containing protein [Xylogone sp. PMI_703]|nr:heterokaryon incompatibility protein-domain-containing protein [Xylogone sp. PMI_703]
MATIQPRRRPRSESMSTIDDETRPRKVFKYEPLDADPDASSIRLVLIEPATDHDCQLSCKLIHAKFAERPKFKALSYMPGDETVKKAILLDGSEFYVGQNLWDALDYLRNSNNDKPLWIDAICINQDDITERNRHLTMMRWIYFRADIVTIWLGKKYSKYQSWLKTQTSHDIVMDQGEQQELETAQKPATKSKMVRELCADGYWNRLWTIQEIGRARQKQVCFGNSTISWGVFINLVTQHNSHCEGPLRLNRLVQGKSSGSHTLRKLLEDHQTAFCKEPRDRIYGLVGVAADAAGFPMAYEKSLIEVWKDTMEYMNRRGLLAEADIVPFGRLIERLLKGTNLKPLAQTLQPCESRPDLAMDNPDNPRVFKLHSYIVGYITVIGPSTVDITSSAKKADQWAAEIQENFREELGEAHRENDTLMRAIMESDETRLASMCFGHVSNVGWRPDDSYYLPKSYVSEIEAIKSNQLVSAPLRSETPLNDILCSSRNASLFLIKSFMHGGTTSKMGIASSLAQPGDLVYRIPGVERALIIRAKIKHNMLLGVQAIGTAILADNIDVDNKTHFTSNRSTFQDNSARLNVRMDALTVYALLT